MAAVDLVKGKKIEDALNIEDGDIFHVMQDVPVQKHHCIQLAVKALHKTIDAYRQDHTVYNIAAMLSDPAMPLNTDCGRRYYV